MTDKEIDLKIHRLLGLETTYTVRSVEHGVFGCGCTLKQANALIKEIQSENPEIAPVIFNEDPDYYRANIMLALDAAKQLSNKNDFTFVLTYNKNETWRAAFGDYKDCEEVEDENPARATCLAIIKFMENKQ